MSTRKAMLSGGTLLAVLAPTAAFVLHDLVFQLPDNQHEASLGLRASGQPTMREYLDHSLAPGPFPLLMGVAVIVGMAGGFLGGKIQDRSAGETVRTHTIASDE